jgi:TonB family protein
MKICPKCQTKFDEEIIRFCTKDGSPLVEENPSFTAMPSQSSIDDIGEETIISRNRPSIPPPAPVAEEEQAARVVIPIGEEKKQQTVRPLENPQRQYEQPRKSNVALIVLLTIFGTIIVLGGGVGVWWILSSQGASVANTNSNSNVNGANNSNVAVNYNSNLLDFLNPNNNVNANENANVNADANTNRTPSPTKTPTPKPSPTVDENSNSDPNINNNTIINITPSNSNTPSKTVTPTPSATPKPSPANTTTTISNVNVGVLNSRAKELRKPAYPPIAKQMGASGKVEVQVSIDEGGNVIMARAISGHPLLRIPAEAAARQSSFYPVKMGDKNVRANGTVVYNFINQ